MNTLLDEIFAGSPDTGPVWNNETASEEFEWGKKLKNAVAGATLRVMEWVADPEGQERKKREQQKADIAIVTNTMNKGQSGITSRELTPIQEIFQEAEMEWAGELEGFLDTGKKDEPPPTKRETPNSKKAWGEFNPGPPQQPTGRRRFEVPLMEEIFMEAEEEVPTAPKGRWGCNDVRCNVYPDPQANVPNSNCPKRVIGYSRGYSNFGDACTAAEKDANSKVPLGCVKRHCNCNTKCRKM